MNEMCDCQIDPDYVINSLPVLQDKISEIEDRSSRNNIRVDGVTQEKRESGKTVKRKS